MSLFRSINQTPSLLCRGHHPSYLKVRFAAQAPDAQNQKSLLSHTSPFRTPVPAPLLNDNFIQLSSSFLPSSSVVDSVDHLVQFSDFRLIVIPLCSAFCKLSGAGQPLLYVRLTSNSLSPTPADNRLFP